MLHENSLVVTLIIKMLIDDGGLFDILFHEIFQTIKLQSCKRMISTLNDLANQLLRRSYQLYRVIALFVG